MELLDIAINEFLDVIYNQYGGEDGISHIPGCRILDKKKPICTCGLIDKLTILGDFESAVFVFSDFEEDYITHTNTIGDIE